MATAREIMSGGAECVGENESLADAAKKMLELDVGALPICGEDNRLKGMLTDRDIVVKTVARGKSPEDTRAGELGEGKPVTIGADDSVEEALQTMAEHKVRRLPVIDGSSRGRFAPAQASPRPRQGDLSERLYAVARTTSQPPRTNDPASSARFFGSWAFFFSGRMSIISSISKPLATLTRRSRLGVCSPVSMRATSD